MKKLLTLLFIAGMFALASCGGAENKTEAAAQDSVANANAASKADSMLNKMAADTMTKVSEDTTKH